uniref:Calcium binding protein 39 like n=1 Tax=Amazona collaria TaxID=241587 RepID=A0A8B9FG56_9PSIT
MPLFSKSHKNPAEIVKILKENMAILEKQEKKTDKASEEVSKSLSHLQKLWLSWRKSCTTVAF